MCKNIAVVISNYAPRGLDGAFRLIREIKPLVQDVILVTNDDLCQKLEVEGQDENVTFLRRPNIGMNIGAWSEAIPFVVDKKFSIFLQDECSLVDAGFVEQYATLFENDGIGMIGESLNMKWDRPWSEIAQSPLNYSIGLGGGRYVSRINYYLDCMSSWKIQPSEGGGHLRALIWAFRSDVLKKIKQFPIGFNKEQCIASEISVSKIVNQFGMRFCQSRETPFSFFDHAEWRKDGTSKINT